MIATLEQLGEATAGFWYVDEENQSVFLSVGDDAKPLVKKFELGRVRQKVAPRRWSDETFPVEVHLYEGWDRDTRGLAGLVVAYILFEHGLTGILSD